MAGKKGLWIVIGVLLLLVIVLLGAVCYCAGFLTARRSADTAPLDTGVKVAQTGEVTERERPVESVKEAEVERQPEMQKQLAGGETSGSGARAMDNAQEKSGIGEKAARTTALEHAGFEESEVSGLSCHIDYEDGRPEFYEITFWAGYTEYDYEIDYYTGTILKSNMDVSAASRQALSTQDSYIGEERAWEIVSEHAAVQESEMKKKECKLDLEDGIWVYEMEFEVGRSDYEYEIDACSGEILKAKID